MRVISWLVHIVVVVLVQSLPSAMAAAELQPGSVEVAGFGGIHARGGGEGTTKGLGTPRGAVRGCHGDCWGARTNDSGPVP